MTSMVTYSTKYPVPAVSYNCTMTAPSKRPPAGLQSRGRAVWRSITGDYELTPAEIEQVRVLAIAADHMARIELAIKGTSKLTSLGSAGQTTSHPMLQEWRAYAEVVRRICSALDLPDLVPAAAPPKKMRPGRIAALSGRIDHNRGA